MILGKWTRIRIAAVGVVLAGLGVHVLRRALQLQVHESPLLREWAEKNYLKETELPPRRGRILDRTDNAMAATIDFDSVFCNPRQLAGVAGAAGTLAHALDRKVAEIEEIIEQPKYFAWLRRRATHEQAAAAMALKLSGVGVRKEAGRVYPGGVAGTVLGHANVDGRGTDGVELAFDENLRGNGVQVPSIRDSYGRELLVEGIVDTSAAAGQDLVVTLDKYLTFVTEQALAAAVKKHNAKAGMAVMMDPRTGEVLAMASVPTYDPNDPGDAVAREARNRVITDEYEPGSTMKTFTFAAAFNAGELRVDDKFDCQNGRMTIGKHTIKDDHPKGILTAADVYKYSSNIGSIKVARKIGKQALYDALVGFGFGKRTGVGLPGERTGILHNVRRWGEIEFATNAFGHGMTVTPLQIVTAFAAIASGGIYRPPRVALRMVQPDGRSEAVPLPANARGEARVISEKAAQTMLTIMQGVTEKDTGGTGKLANIEGYPVAGKTGTALKAVNGRYDMQKYVGSFIGIVPANDPRLVIGVMIDEPQPIHYGGIVAAPVFKEIAEEALKYLSVPPTTPIVAKKEKAKKAAEVKRVVEEEMKEGQLPVVGLPVVGELEEGAQQAEDGQERVVLPSFAGMTMGQVIHVARRAGVEVEVEGSGLVVGQSPAAGPVPRGSVCRVSFRPGG